MNDKPLYASKRTARSLWQQYRIYRDRLKLQAWVLFHTVVVPVGEIRAIEVRPSVFGGRKGFTPGLKMITAAQQVGRLHKTSRPGA